MWPRSSSSWQWHVYCWYAGDVLTLCFLRCRHTQMLGIMAGMGQKDSFQRHSFGFFWEITY